MAVDTVTAGVLKPNNPEERIAPLEQRAIVIEGSVREVPAQPESGVGGPGSRVIGSNSAASTAANRSGTRSGSNASSSDA